MLLQCLPIWVKCEKVNFSCGWQKFKEIFQISFYLFDDLKISHLMTKPTKWLYTQRRLRSSAESDQSSLWARWVAKDPSFRHAHREDSDQTGQMPRLIWVYTGYMSFCWFCHAAVQMFTLLCLVDSSILSIWQVHFHSRDVSCAFSFFLNIYTRVYKALFENYRPWTYARICSVLSGPTLFAMTASTQSDQRLCCSLLR